MSSRSILTVMALSLTSVSAFAAAPNFIKRGATTKSCTYSTKPNNQGAIGVRVTIYPGGTTGEYQPNGSGQKGSLFDIKYNRDIGDGNIVDMAGRWKFGGAVGTFFWTFEGNKFNGSYRKSNDGQYTPTDGFWNGSF